MANFFLDEPIDWAAVDRRMRKFLEELKAHPSWITDEGDYGRAWQNQNTHDYWYGGK